MPQIKTEQKINPLSVNFVSNKDRGALLILRLPTVNTIVDQTTDQQAINTFTFI